MFPLQEAWVWSLPRIKLGSCVLCGTAIRVFSNSCPLRQWCYLTISSSATPFSSSLQCSWYTKLKFCKCVLLFSENILFFHKKINLNSMHPTIHCPDIWQILSPLRHRYMTLFWLPDKANNLEQVTVFHWASCTTFALEQEWTIYLEGPYLLLIFNLNIYIYIFFFAKHTFLFSSTLGLWCYMGLSLVTVHGLLTAEASLIEHEL